MTFRWLFSIWLFLIAGQAMADQCFERRYDAAHLAANKDQSVAFLQARLPSHRSGEARVRVTFRKTRAELQAEEAEAEAASSRGEEAPTTAKPKLYEAVLLCWAPAPGAPEGAWQCGVECDGGTFTAWESGGSLLLRTRGGFLVSGACGTDDDQAQRYVTDTNAIETTFRLDPIDIANCDENE